MLDEKGAGMVMGVLSCSLDFFKLVYPMSGYQSGGYKRSQYPKAIQKTSFSVGECAL